MNYDAWFDLLHLEIQAHNIENARATCEEAIKNLPLIQEKRYWRRYLYLWYSYALFEELEAHDMERTAQVFERALKLVPHEKFTFSKLWIYFAHF